MSYAFPADGSVFRHPSFLRWVRSATFPNISGHIGMLRLPAAPPALPRLPSASPYHPTCTLRSRALLHVESSGLVGLVTRATRPRTFYEWRRQDLPEVPGEPMHARPALRPRRADPLLAIAKEISAACWRIKTIGRRDFGIFGAQSHSSHARCLRFAVGLPFPTQDSLLAWWLTFGQAGLSPAGLLPRISVSHTGTSFPTGQASLAQ